MCLCVLKLKIIDQNIRDIRDYHRYFYKSSNFSNFDYRKQSCHFTP